MGIHIRFFLIIYVNNHLDFHLGLFNGDHKIYIFVSTKLVRYGALFQYFTKRNTSDYGDSFYRRSIM